MLEFKHQKKQCSIDSSRRKNYPLETGVTLTFFRKNTLAVEVIFGGYFIDSNSEILIKSFIKRFVQTPVKGTNALSTKLEGRFYLGAKQACLQERTNENAPNCHRQLKGFGYAPRRSIWNYAVIPVLGTSKNPPNIGGFLRLRGSRGLRGLKG